MGNKTGTETTPIGKIPFTIAAPLAKSKKKAASGREKIKKVPRKKFAPQPREDPRSTTTTPSTGRGTPEEEHQKKIQDILDRFPAGTHQKRKRRPQSPAARAATMRNLKKARAALKAKNR